MSHRINVTGRKKLKIYCSPTKFHLGHKERISEVEQQNFFDGIAEARTFLRGIYYLLLATQTVSQNELMLD
jgi:hypothetical protein